MLHVEVSKLWSRGIITLFTDSRAQYDHTSNSLTKYGKNLKVGDLICRSFGYVGPVSAGLKSWRVVELEYTEALNINDLIVGYEYGVYVREKGAVQSFRLQSVDLDSKVSKQWFVSTRLVLLRILTGLFLTSPELLF